MHSRKVVLVVCLAVLVGSLMSIPYWADEISHPKIAKARRALGRGATKAEVFLEAGAFQMAADEYRKLIGGRTTLIRNRLDDGVQTKPEINFQLAAYYFNYGKSLQKTSDPEGALNAYTTLDEMVHRLRGVTRYARGAALLDLKRYEEALEEFNAATELNPELYDAFQDRCVTLRYMQRYEDAIAACQDTVTRFPAVAKSRLSLGWAYDLAGQREKAVESYAKAAQLAPDWKKPGARLEEIRQQPAQVVGSDQ